MTSPERRALARKLASSAATLLQNKAAILPLNAAELMKIKGGIALIGQAGRKFCLYLSLAKKCYSRMSDAVWYSPTRPNHSRLQVGLSHSLVEAGLVLSCLKLQ